MPPKTATPVLASARVLPARKAPANTSGDTSDTSTNKDQGKGKEKSTEGQSAAKGVMGPPPDPPRPQGILEPEMNALVECLINATVTTGQIFRFQSEAKRLGISKHVPRPPRSLTSSLAYEIGRYDQICDALEYHTTRAIAVLQRDFAREEARIRAEEEEKARAKAAHPQLVEDVEMTPLSETKKTSSPAGPGANPLTQLRRQSKMSFSTLQRNPFPLKLDLTGTGLRMDEATLSSIGGLSSLGAMSSIPGMGSMNNMGLASPISLAPKSARPMDHGELPPEIMAALAAAGENQAANQHIDLTLDDAVQNAMNVDVDKGVGSSADKPIELDLDYDSQMTEIFGEQPDGAQATGSDLDIEQRSSLEILKALSSGDGNENADDLFAQLNNGAAAGDSSSLAAPQEGSVAPAPSPSAFLADLTSSHDDPTKADGSSGDTSSSVPFDLNQIDMSDVGNMTSGFSPYEFNGMDQEGMKRMMESLLAQNSSGDSSGSTTGGNASGSSS